MADELTSREKIEDDGEAHAGILLPESAGETSMNGFSEIFNPLEGLEIVFEEPVAGLMAIASLVVIMFLAGGLWSVAKELVFGGGPPQSLGLK